jgi:hypothetical protein
MPQKDDNIKDGIKDSLKDSLKDNRVKNDKVDYYQEHDQEHEEGDNNRHHERDYKNGMLISDIHNNFYNLLDDYSNADDRLKWVGMSDILYGRRFGYKIIYDEVILQFIDKFMEQIEGLLKYMKRKRLHIIEDDCEEFERLVSLNENIVYSRIAGCLEKWLSLSCINTSCSFFL